MRTYLLILVLLGFSFAYEKHEHDGFLFRGGVGFAHTSGSTSFFGQDLKASGIGFGLNLLHLGFSINPNVSLSMEISGTVSSDATVEVNGKKVDESGKLEIGNGFIGPAISYYIMPENVFLSLGLGLGIGTSKSKNAEGATDPGLGVSLTAGKEWYVSENWSLGFALNYLSIAAKDQECGNSDCSYSGDSFGFYFSATFN